MHSAVDISQIILALGAVIGGIVTLVAWFYRRGGHERAYTDALDRNTNANNEVAVELRDFKAVVLEMFHALDKRVTRTEDRLGL